MKSLLICLMVFSSKPNPRIQKSNIIINKTRDLSNSELDSDLRKGYDERYDNPIKNSSVFKDDENSIYSIDRNYRIKNTLKTLELLNSQIITSKIYQPDNPFLNKFILNSISDLIDKNSSWDDLIRDWNNDLI